MASNTTIQAKVTKTGTFNGASIAIDSGSGSPAFAASDEFTIFINILNHTGSFHFELQDSVDAFSASVVRKVWEVSGSGNVKKTFSVTWKELRGLRLGTASAVMRLAIVEGAGSTVTYSCEMVRNR